MVRVLKQRINAKKKKKKKMAKTGENWRKLAKIDKIAKNSFKISTLCGKTEIKDSSYQSSSW
jgi:hypothetical protein